MSVAIGNALSTPECPMQDSRPTTDSSCFEYKKTTTGSSRVKADPAPRPQRPPRAAEVSRRMHGAGSEPSAGLPGALRRPDATASQDAGH